MNEPISDSLTKLCFFLFLFLYLPQSRTHNAVIEALNIILFHYNEMLFLAMKLQSIDHQFPIRNPTAQRACALGNFELKTH